MFIDYVVWYLGCNWNLILVIQIGADGKNPSGWWKLRPWLIMLKLWGSLYRCCHRCWSQKKTLVLGLPLLAIFWGLRTEWVGNWLYLSTVWFYFSLQRWEPKWKFTWYDRVLCSCSLLEFVELLFNLGRIGAMTRILCVKLLKQINFSFRGIYTSLYFLLGSGIFKLIATCIKAIVITSSNKLGQMVLSVFK